MTKNSRLVYSTDRGRIKVADNGDINSGPDSRQRKASKRKPEKSDGIVRVRRETSGRKGKGVTTINGLSLPENELKILLKQLKRNCSTGGTAKNGVIEIQGDHRDRVRDILSDAGYQVKLAGG